jgi:hypothetical protein
MGVRGLASWVVGASTERPIRQETHMSKPDSKQGNDQRGALNDSEKRAERERPENFKDDETRSKVVEVFPIDGDSIPIRGIDPDKKPPAERT